MFSRFVLNVWLWFFVLRYFYCFGFKVCFDCLALIFGFKVFFIVLVLRFVLIVWFKGIFVVLYCLFLKMVDGFVFVECLRL